MKKQTTEDRYFRFKKIIRDLDFLLFEIMSEHSRSMIGSSDGISFKEVKGLDELNNLLLIKMAKEYVKEVEAHMPPFVGKV